MKQGQNLQSGSAFRLEQLLVITRLGLEKTVGQVPKSVNVSECDLKAHRWLLWGVGDSDTNGLCDPRQVTFPLWDSVCGSVKQE